MDGKEPNRTCVVCGQRYHLCPTCEKNENRFFSWRLIACSPRCYQIHNIVHSWFYGEIDASKAQDQLLEFGYFDLETVSENVREAADKIFADAEAAEKN